MTTWHASDRCCVAAQIECDFDWVSDQDVEMAVTPLPSALPCAPSPSETLPRGFSSLSQGISLHIVVETL